jgi:hypothetical protein
VTVEACESLSKWPIMRDVRPPRSPARGVICGSRHPLLWRVGYGPKSSVRNTEVGRLHERYRSGCLVHHAECRPSRRIVNGLQEAFSVVLLAAERSCPSSGITCGDDHVRALIQSRALFQRLCNRPVARAIRRRGSERQPGTTLREVDSVVMDLGSAASSWTGWELRSPFRPARDVGSSRRSAVAASIGA